MITQISTLIAGVVIGINITSPMAIDTAQTDTPEIQVEKYLNIHQDVPTQELETALAKEDAIQDSTEKEEKATTPAPTPVPSRNPQPVPAPEELEAWFSTYSQAFNVSAELLKTIARCESGFNPNSQGGIYGGMFQYSASTWASTRNAMGLDPNPDLRYNAEESIKTSAWKISAGGIGAWPHCGKQLASSQISH